MGFDWNNIPMATIMGNDYDYPCHQAETNSRSLVCIAGEHSARSRNVCRKSASHKNLIPEY